jgi:hypothetical protein
MPTRLALAALLALATLGACQPDPDALPEGSALGEAAPLYREVTATHLPAAAREGFTMDVKAADLDADGDLDLVLAREFAPNVLLLGDGTGRFADASDRLPQTARDSEDVAFADVDGDGDLDVLVVSEDDRLNELYLNDGAARFTDASAHWPVDGISNALVARDLTGDGVRDLLVGNNGQNALLVGDGQGGFVDETLRRLPAYDDVTQDLELGDVDGDGDLDLVVANEGPNRLLLNNGSGAFRNAPDGALPTRDAPEETREADLGDADGDGHLDLALANTRLFVDGADAQSRLLLGDGTGRFADATERLPADTSRTMDLDWIDVDGDGDLDLVAAALDDLRGQRAQAPFRVWRNDGTARFTDATDAVFPPGVTGNGLDIEAFDADGDGRLDLYLGSRGGGDRLLLRR